MIKRIIFMIYTDSAAAVVACIRACGVHREPFFARGTDAGRSRESVYYIFPQEVLYVLCEKTFDNTHEKGKRPT